jgi:hypothetical protein
MPGLPAATLENGEAFAFPDVCKTPVGPALVPLPFPNVGMCPAGVESTTKVLVANMPALTQGSQIPMSQGDEPGVGGGVISGVNMGQVAFKVGSSKVTFQGQKAVILTAITGQNGSNANAVGAIIAPSQATVLVAP